MKCFLCVSLFVFLVCLFGVLHPTWEFFTQIETPPVLVNNMIGYWSVKTIRWIFPQVDKNSKLWSSSQNKSFYHYTSRNIHVIHCPQIGWHYAEDLVSHSRMIVLHLVLTKILNFNFTCHKRNLKLNKISSYTTSL